MDSILVIDDEEGIQFTLREVLKPIGLPVLTCATAEAALRIIQQESPLVILLDIRLGTESGMELFSRIKRLLPKSLVVFITGHGTAEMAIEAIKMGAFDYLTKPLDCEHLTAVVEQAVRIAKLMSVPASVDAAEKDHPESDRLIGTGPAMQAVCKQIGRVAPQDVNVLILGESGTGKELVARAIYQHSRRHQNPFLAINCAAIPESLLESELFGHEQGAFTGADRRRIGKFEQCHNGTIFLDEVGDMPLTTQVKILRLLQDGQFQRVGGNEPLTTNVRVIAATNQNLDAMIAAGKFRSDLFYRLRGVTLVLPPLRERKEDISELAHYFLFRLNRQLGTAFQSIAAEALEKMQNYPWPGNVRELQGAIRESMILSTGPTLLPDYLPLDTYQQRWMDADERASDLGPINQDAWQEIGATVQHWIQEKTPDVYRKALHLFDRVVIRLAMHGSQGHLGRTSELLGLSRPTLRAKINSILAKGEEK